METRGVSSEQAADWRASAACRRVDPDDMFPDPGNRDGVLAAQRVCGRCPVWDVCLADALADEGGKTKDNRYGIRGGLTPSQRHSRHRMNLRNAA